MQQHIFFNSGRRSSKSIKMEPNGQLLQKNTHDSEKVKTLPPPT